MQSSLDQFWMDHPELARRKNKVSATFAITYQPLAAGAQQIPGQVQTAGFDFICTRIVGKQTAVGNATYILTPLLLQIVIGAVSFNLNNTKVEWSTSGIQVNPDTVEGTDLPYPILIPGQSTINSSMDNPTAVACNVWLNFIGLQCGGGAG